jgi:hypothetical protein
MTGLTLGYVLLGAAELVWLWVATALRIVYRPRTPREGPVTSELRDEPPAVVNLITNRWTVTAPAAAATVLDLAHRGAIEIIQVSPERDVVQIRRRADDVGDLRPYERQVLDHLRQRAVGGVVPTEALTTGPASASDKWWARFRRSVVSDARARGLSRDRFPTAVIAGAGASLVLLAIALYALLRATPDSGPEGPAPWTLIGALLLFGACVAAAGKFKRDRQRDTDAGLAAACHWLGVRRGYAEGNYDELPPAAVILYERHLAYAAAMDVARRCIRRLPLGAEDDHLAWSSAGGRWRLVRVRYPQHRVGWGLRPLTAVVTGLAWTATLLLPLYVLNRFGSGLRVDLQDAAHTIGNVDDPSSRVFDQLTADRIALGMTWLIVVALAVVTLNALARGGLRLLRGLADAHRSRTITGLVLRQRTWPTRRSDQQEHWVAVDDGSTDRVAAFRVRPVVAERLHQGDVVSVRVSPFLGFVRSAEIVTAAVPLPAPRPIDQLPGPTFLPPVHWSERPGAPGMGGSAAEEAPVAAATPSEALARQLVRLFSATRAARRSAPR